MTKKGRKKTTAGERKHWQRKQANKNKTRAHAHTKGAKNVFSFFVLVTGYICLVDEDGGQNVTSAELEPQMAEENRTETELAVERPQVAESVLRPEQTGAC